MAEPEMMHTVYKGPEGETTQWDDIQSKMGNLPPKEPKWKADPFAPKQAAAKDEGWLEKKNVEQLEELEDEFADDAFLEQYRCAAARGTGCPPAPPPPPRLCGCADLRPLLLRRHQRIHEMQKAASRPRFGTLEGIRGSEFVQKVTEASAEVWVVVLLYKESHEACALLLSCFEDLAAKYPSSKFVKIISTDCIPNYPDQNLPTVLIYHGGAVKHNLVGLAHWGGRTTTPEQVGGWTAGRLWWTRRPPLDLLGWLRTW
jgi:hypothetical protein